MKPCHYRISLHYHSESNTDAKHIQRALAALATLQVADAPAGSIVDDDTTGAKIVACTTRSSCTPRHLLTTVDALMHQHGLPYQCAFIREVDEYNTAKKLVVFDMDATLVNSETLDELATAIGIGDSVSAITAQAMRGEIDFADSFTRRVALLKNTPVATAAKVRNNIQLQAGARTLCAALRARGTSLALLSGGFHYFADPIAEQLDISHVHANTLAVQGDVLTGDVVRPIVGGEAKREFIHSLMQQHKLRPAEVCAVGDGANDLLMLETAGFGVAFCGKPILQKHIANQVNVPNLAHLVHQLCSPYNTL